jgi:hypothetical protein
VAVQRVLHRLEVLLEVACPSEFELLPGPGVVMSDIQYRKKAVYAEFGIPAYWIVLPDPDQPSVTAYALARDRYAEVGRAVGEQRFATATPFPVEIVRAVLVTARWRR